MRRIRHQLSNLLKLLSGRRGADTPDYSWWVIIIWLGSFGLLVVWVLAG